MEFRFLYWVFIPIPPFLVVVDVVALDSYLLTTDCDCTRLLASLLLCLCVIMCMCVCVFACSRCRMWQTSRK